MVNFNATLIAQILNFLILVFVLAKFAYKPVVRIMDERKNKIAGDLEAAEKTKAEQDQIIATAKEAIALEKKKAMDDIRVQVISLSMIAAGKIVEQKLGSEEDKKLAGEIVDSILKK